MRCPLCPYYEQKTSYGTEVVKCKNTDCPYKAEVIAWMERKIPEPYKEGVGE